MGVNKPEIWTRGGHRLDYLSSKYGDQMPLSPDGADVLYHEYGAQLRRTSDGRYLLNVLCGRVGQSGVEIELTTQELDSYRDEGDVFIHRLSDEIYHDPEHFRSRYIRTC